MVRPLKSKTEVQAEAILRELGLSAGERNVLTLLALADLTHDRTWAQAQCPARRISEIIDFINQHYGKRYAPNTRETIRKQSVHVFRDEGLIRENQPSHKTNPNFAYQLTLEALTLLRSFDTPAWPDELRRFRAQFPTPGKLRRWLAVPADQIHLTALRLCNFRSLVDTGWIPTRPLTVLVGRNSSGKSSFLRYLPLLRQTAAERSASPLSWFSPTGDVDFGDFSRVVWRDATPREIRIGMRFSFQTDDAPPIPVEAELTLDDHNGQTSLHAYALRSLDQEALLGFDDEGVLTTFTVGPVDVLKLGYAAQREAGQLLPRLKEGADSVPVDAPDLAQVVPDLLLALNQWLVRFSMDIHYSGPVRATPSRLYRSREAMVSQVDPTGGNLAMFLSSLPEPKRRDFSQWVADRFGFQVSVESAGSLTVEINVEEHGQRFNLIDVGYGFSQVLPILAQSWASLSGVAINPRDPTPSFLALEQPELHLHPHHAERLADVFAGLVSHSERPLSVMVETHSETLVNRFGDLIAEGALRPEQVQVLLFEKDPSTGASAVRRAEYDDRGFLRDWPIGFFAP